MEALCRILLKESLTLTTDQTLKLCVACYLGTMNRYDNNCTTQNTKSLNMVPAFALDLVLGNYKVSEQRLI